MPNPRMVIEISPVGVEIITIRVNKGEREEGLKLLRRALPALRALNRRIGPSGVRTKVAVGCETGRAARERHNKQ